MKTQALLLLWLSSAVLACSPTDNGRKSSPSPDAVLPGGDPVAKAATSAASRNGPFGIDFGQKISELDKADPSGRPDDGVFLLNTVPRPASEIVTYGVEAYDQTGVCEIRAASKTFDSDSTGVSVKSAIDDMAGILKSKYGDTKKFDYCEENYCRFFQMGMKNGSSGYGYEWSKKFGSKMPPEISSVILAARPGEYNDTYYTLIYTSSKRSECDKARNALKAANL
jgi:hypothetical protein